MKQMYTNATVRWTEEEIALRDALILEIPIIMKRVWNNVREGIRFIRTETPILTPTSVLQHHIDTGFNLVPTEDGFLRPETTAGTFESFRQDFPMIKQDLKKFQESAADLREYKRLEKIHIVPMFDDGPPKVVVPKYLPICYWQAGKSFRTEAKADTMRASKLRLAEFWQIEFQLFCMKDTKADYLTAALEALTNRYGGVAQLVPDNELPHYSAFTIDWMMSELEVAGCSKRKDFEGLDVFEVAIGLDRLLALILKRD